MLEFSFEAAIWVYQGKAKIYFVTVPEDIATSIKAFVAGPRRGWGAVRVTVRIGETCWRTSMFPMSAQKTYILPIKAEVRKVENLAEGSCPSICLMAEPDLI